MSHIERVKEVRAIVEPHYNCGQSILVPFCKELGMTEEQAYALGAHLGKGMRHGGTCGALSGALLVLGGLGYGEEEAAQLIRRFREDHGATDCASLLRAAHDRGEERKPHCDALVYEMVRALEDLQAQG